MRSFATMLEAGVPLYSALYHLGENFTDPQASMLCQATVKDIGNDNPLSKAATRHPKSFTNTQIGLMRVGFQEKADSMLRSDGRLQILDLWTSW